MPPHRHDPDGAVQVKRIGQGAEGTVTLWRRRKDGRPVVRKKFHDRRIVDPLPLEVEILHKTLPYKHPRIIRMFRSEAVVGHNAADLSLCLYYEYCGGGDLSKYLPKRGDMVPEAFIWHIFLQMADALALLHYGYDRHERHPDRPPRGWQRVVHRDIKPENIFFVADASTSSTWGPYPSLVLADFGLATLRPVGEERVGTAYWQPPELPEFSAKADVWALGAIIHAFAHREAPLRALPIEWPDTPASRTRVRGVWLPSSNAIKRSPELMNLSSEYEMLMTDFAVDSYAAS